MMKSAEEILESYGLSHKLDIPLVAYQLVFKPGLAMADGTRNWTMDYVHIEAQHAGEPFRMVLENDGLWLTRLTEIFDAAEALAIMMQIEMGQNAYVPGAYTIRELALLRFHRDMLRLA